MTFKSRFALSIGALAVLAITGCTGLSAHPASTSVAQSVSTSTASPSATASAQATATASANATTTSAKPVAPFTGVDMLPYWGASDSENNLQSEQKALGLGRIYDNGTATSTGSFNNTPYVATYLKRCLVLISYDQKYRNDSLNRIPMLEVVVFNRYGLTEKQGLWYDNLLKYSAVKKALTSQTARCK